MQLGEGVGYVSKSWCKSNSKIQGIRRRNFLKEAEMEATTPQHHEQHTISTTRLQIPREDRPQACLVQSRACSPPMENGVCTSMCKVEGAAVWTERWHLWWYSMKHNGKSTAPGA
jgi:hypothetical protein